MPTRPVGDFPLHKLTWKKHHAASNIVQKLTISKTKQYFRWDTYILFSCS
jgi:hypothetical protein